MKDREASVCGENAVGGAVEAHGGVHGGAAVGNDLRRQLFRRAQTVTHLQKKKSLRSTR